MTGPAENGSPAAATDSRDVVVVGGGVAGLSAAVY
ncbi:thioredoxin reductase, partial [Halorubrum sp. SS5]